MERRRSVMFWDGDFRFAYTDVIHVPPGVLCPRRRFWADRIRGSEAVYREASIRAREDWPLSYPGYAIC